LVFELNIGRPDLPVEGQFQNEVAPNLPRSWRRILKRKNPPLPSDPTLIKVSHHAAKSGYYSMAWRQWCRFGRPLAIATRNIGLPETSSRSRLERLSAKFILCGDPTPEDWPFDVDALTAECLRPMATRESSRKTTEAPAVGVYVEVGSAGKVLATSSRDRQHQFDWSRKGRSGNAKSQQSASPEGAGGKQNSK
jgi:hypothetical protein